MRDQNTTGLVLTGGGARAAYQVGVLKAISDEWQDEISPFGILAGSSAGAINTAALACGAHHFRQTVGHLWQIWYDLKIEKVFSVASQSFFRIGAKLVRDLTFGGVLRHSTSNHLLDTAPLRKLLLENMKFDSIVSNIEKGALKGFSISATNYYTGTGIIFFDGPDTIKDWARSHRMSRRSQLGVDHVLASCAIPIFFPPVKIGESYYGDGCIRLSTPFSPAIHMGASRILAIGIRFYRSIDHVLKVNSLPMDKVSFAEISGVLLNSIFLDALDADLERLERINRTVTKLNQKATDELRAIPTLAIRPSKDLGSLAASQFHNFPPLLRYLLRGLGADEKTGSELLSYLAFDNSYTRQLLELGYQDGMTHRESLREFLECGIEGGAQDRLHESC